MEVKNSSKLFTRKSDKLILKKKEISRLKLFENVYISIQDESIKLYIHEEKLSQPQATLVNYLSQPNHSSIAYLPKLEKRQKIGYFVEYQIICLKCQSPCHGISNLQIKIHSSQKLEQIREIFICIVESYKNLTQNLINKKSVFDNHVFKFEDVLYEISCSCSSSIILLDLGKEDKLNKSNNFLSLTKMLEFLCFPLCDLHQQVQKNIGKIINELIPPQPYQFYESLLRASSILKSLQFKKHKRSSNHKCTFKKILQEQKTDKQIGKENLKINIKQDTLEKAFTIENFLRKDSEKSLLSTKRNMNSTRKNRQISKSKSLSRKKKQPLNIFKNPVDLNVKRQSLKLDNFEKEKKIMTKLNVLRDRFNKNLKNINRKDQKRLIQWSEIERISQQMSNFQNNCSTIKTIPSNKVIEVLEIAEKQTQKVIKESKSTKQHAQKCEDPVEMILQAIQKKLNEEINPLGEGVNRTKQLLQKYKQKNLLGLYLLYKKFFYLRVSFLTTLMNNQQSVFPKINQTQWKQIVKDKRYADKLSSFNEQNNKILTVLEKYKEKVQEKVQKKSIKISKKAILEIIIDDDESYQAYIESLIKINYHKYLLVFEQTKKSNNLEDQKKLIEYGNIIILAILDDLQGNEHHPEFKKYYVEESKSLDMEKQKSLLEKSLKILIK